MSISKVATVLVVFVVPGIILASEVGIVPCDGVFERCEACHFVQLGQNIISWFIEIMAAVIAFVFAWAGVKMVMSAGNSEGVTSAKHMMTNALIGFVILLAGWLIIDTVLKLFIADPDNQRLGTWNEIECTTQPDIHAISPRTSTGAGIGSGGRGTGARCGAGNLACSPSTLAALGLSDPKANALSCIAITESSGNPSIGPYNLRHHGSNSSACGTFQITRTTWEGTATGACSSFSKCTNAQCNAQVAVKLVQQSGYRSWTCPGCNSKAQGCVSRYDP